jgi:hypothetical protein
MTALKLNVALVVFLCAHLCSAADSAGPAKARPSLEDADRAYEILLEVHIFVFGGVGFAGSISEGEKAFRTVLASTKALSLFRKTVAKGSNEAKLYAICGIRHLDKRSFDGASKALVVANPEITTMAGCFVGHEKASTIVKRIADGFHDTDISDTRSRKP